MSKDHIRYDLLVQDALKGVVRKVLADSSRDGLPPDHHFYVSFRTDLPGSKVSSRLREKYPEEMTIVLQHQFWDLIVSDSQFEVGLSFGGIPERLVVPFDAITGFYDPSVEFGLKFEVNEDPETEAGADDKPAGPRLAAVDDSAEDAPRPFTPRSLRERAAAAAAAENAGEALADGAATEAASADVDAQNDKDVASAEDAAVEEEAAEDAAPSGGAQVVSLDAFRKKQ